MSKENMHAAYRVANEILQDRLRAQDPAALDELEKVREADVLVTRGQYDRIESVFGVTGTPYTLVDPFELERATLRPDQIVFVNCPGKFGRQGLENLAAFVHEGGYLFTTDWALKHTLESALPGYVRFNGRPTHDEVVRVEIENHQDPFLGSILGPEDDPQWWLEGSSYPITIQATDKVQVLLSSKEVEQKYGESPVFVTFQHGDGCVYHMLSHFYLQRNETRTRRHAASSANYLAEKQIDPALYDKYQRMGIGRLSTGDVESALASRGMIAKVLHDKRRSITRRSEERENG